MAYTFNSNSGLIDMSIDGTHKVPQSYNMSFLELTKARSISTRVAVTVMSKKEGRPLLYQLNDLHQTADVEVDVSKIAFSPNDNLHSHDYFELTFVAEGEVEMQIETRVHTYKAGDVLLLNRNTRHSEERLKDGTTIYYLCLTREYMLEWPKEDEQLLASKAAMTRFINKNLDDGVRRNKDYIEFLYTAEPSQVIDLEKEMQLIIQELQLKKPGYMLILRGLIFRFLSQVNDHTLYSSTVIDLASDREINLANETKYFLDRTKHRITRGELSNAIHYNGDYLNRLFKKHFGCSVKEYNQKVYMQEALKLLVKTSLSVQEISKQLGIENKTHFYSLFEQHFETTPSQYRQNAIANHQKDPEIVQKL